MSARPRRHPVSARAAILLSALALPLHAEDAQPIALEYRAPASCPDETALLSRIRARIDVRRVPRGERAPSFEVSLEPRGVLVIGRVAATSEGGEPTSREVSGTDCSHVLDALALIVSMGLRQEAVRGDVAPEDPGIPAAPAALPREISTSASSAEAGARAGEPRWRLLGSGQVAATVGYVTAPLVSIGARVQLFRTAREVGGPSIALGLAAVRPTERAVSEGQVSLTFTMGELAICPASVSLSGSLAFSPCARVAVGRVDAAGSGIVNARSESRLWSSVGALGQLFFVPVKPFVVEGQASIFVPLTPYEFGFAPRSIVYEAPPLGFSASLGVGVMFL